MSEEYQNPYAAPLETTNGDTELSDTQPAFAAELRSRSVLLMIVLAVITLGLYINYWVHRNAQSLNTALGQELISRTTIALFWSVSIFSLGMIIPYAYAEQESSIHGLSNMLDIANTLFVLFMAFAVRGSLDELLLRSGCYDNRTRFRGIWTFLFGIFYLQWKINRNRNAGLLGA